MTFLLGPNGTGKTAVLQALVRLFGLDPSARRIRRGDFHIAQAAAGKPEEGTLTLWIEAQFEFPELIEAGGRHATIPVHFAHMQLESADGVPRIRFRLTGVMDDEGDIEETMVYVVQVDEDEEPTNTVAVQKHDRNAIQVHYLPARRDPNDHISYAANSLLGRVLRATDWEDERETIAGLTENIGEALAENAAVGSIGDQLLSSWSALYKGTYFATPSISFGRNEIENLLRHLTVGFTPGHGEPLVDFSRLSDGQQSLLYVSLVLAVQAIGRQVLDGTLEGIDPDKLRPAVFTLLAMEEPENSLSPHYLGRVIKALTTFGGHHDAQAIVATHAPSLLKRVPPENIRYLRLNTRRRTIVRSIVMPDAGDEAHKFVREAIQAFPELYFSRLAVLGEGDSEEIVLPRLLRAGGLGDDDTCISIVPLGGRHVNHFWRLLHGLGIPHVTLLDLDLARHQGGWGRIRYAAIQLLKFPPEGIALEQAQIDGIPKWDSGEELLLDSELGRDWIAFLESVGVFFSSPLDIDFAMLRAFPDAFAVGEDEPDDPDAAMIAAVLGKSHGDVNQYSEDDQQHFEAYHRRFKLGSKPAAHLQALAQLDDEALNANIPDSIGRLLEMVRTKLADLPE